MQSGKIWKNRGLRTAWKNARMNLQKKLIPRKYFIETVYTRYFSNLRMVALYAITLRAPILIWPLSIYVGTWNINSKKPGVESLAPWLNSYTDTPPDIVAIGYAVSLIMIVAWVSAVLTNHCVCSLQELDMSAESLLLREMVSRSAPWSEAIAQTLNAKPDLVEYYLVRNGRVDWPVLVLLTPLTGDYKAVGRRVVDRVCQQEAREQNIRSAIDHHHYGHHGCYGMSPCPCVSVQYVANTRFRVTKVPRQCASSSTTRRFVSSTRTSTRIKPTCSAEIKTTLTLLRRPVSLLTAFKQQSANTSTLNLGIISPAY